MVLDQLQPGPRRDPDPQTHLLHPVRRLWEEQFLLNTDADLSSACRDVHFCVTLGYRPRGGSSWSILSSTPISLQSSRVSSTLLTDSSLVISSSGAAIPRVLRRHGHAAPQGRRCGASSSSLFLRCGCYPPWLNVGCTTRRFARLLALCWSYDVR